MSLKGFQARTSEGKLMSELTRPSWNNQNITLNKQQQQQYYNKVCIAITIIFTLNNKSSEDVHVVNSGKL